MFTENEKRIIEKAANIDKLLISRQDDNIRDDMLLEICREIRKKESVLEDRLPILIIFDNNKYAKAYEKFAAFEEELGLEIICTGSFDYSLKQYERNKNIRYKALIIDNLRNIYEFVSKEAIGIRLINNATDIFEKRYKEFKLITTYDGFLREGILDLYLFMLVFHKRRFKIMKLDEPESLLRMILVTKENDPVPYNQRTIVDVKIPEVFIKMIRENAAFDDFFYDGSCESMPKIEVIKCSHVGEIAKQLCKQILDRYKNTLDNQVVIIPYGIGAGFHQNLYNTLKAIGIRESDICFDGEKLPCKDKRIMLFKNANKDCVVKLENINANVIYHIGFDYIQKCGHFFSCEIELIKKHVEKKEQIVFAVESEMRDACKKFFESDALSTPLPLIFDKLEEDENLIQNKIINSYREMIDIFKKAG